MKSKWQYVRIEDVAEKVAMGPFGSNIKVETFVSNGVPIISGTHLREFFLSENDFNFITPEHAKKLKNSIVYPGDVIFTHAGNVGQVAMIPYDCKYPYYMISQRQFYLRCDKNRILPEFVTYFFHSNIGKGKLLANVNSTGVPSITQPSTYLKSIEIPLPSLQEQKEIVSLLNSIENKIANNKKINHHLEQMAQAIFKSWFVDFEPWGGVMPKDWREGTVSDLGEVIGGSTPSKEKPEYYTENGIAWITPKDLSINKNKYISHGANDITELGLQNSSTRLMPQGTVLFSSRAPIGYIAIASDEVCTNQGFKSIVPKGKVGTAFIYYFMIENLQTIENMASGSTFKEISGSAMKSVPATIPDTDTLRNFQFNCTPLFEKQELLESENAHLAALRDTLLPRLMSGELSTNNL